MGVRVFWKLNSKQAALCASFGGAAYALRVVNLVIPIGGPFVIDARDIPGIVGATLSGPIGGIIVGFLAGIPSKFPIVDIPSFVLAYFLVGILAQVLTRWRWLSALGALTGYLVAAFIVWQLGLMPTLWGALVSVAPRAIVIVPVQLSILLAIFRRWPNILETIRM